MAILTDRGHYPFFQAAAEQFQTDNPDLTILVTPRGGRVRFEGNGQAIRDFSDFVRKNRAGIEAAASPSSSSR